MPIMSGYGAELRGGWSWPGGGRAVIDQRQVVGAGGCSSDRLRTEDADPALYGI